MLRSVIVRSIVRTRLTAVLEIAAVAMLIALLTSPARAQIGGIPLGAHAPSAMVETLDGRAIDLASYTNSGKPVVLEFWATWCPLCRRLEPTMAAARTKYEGQVMFVSVGVSGNQTPERQRAHAEANKMTGEFVFDRHDNAQKAYSALHTSYVVVLDAKGVVVYTGMGESQDIDAAVRKGLAGSMP
jgi:thiol-disulfide isomerase/thioredoxin